MKQILTVILAVATAVCSIGWLNSWVARAALIKYMLDKEYTPPTDKEMETCLAWAWKKTLGIKE